MAKPTTAPGLSDALSGAGRVQRPPAEILHAEELARLRAADKDPRPPGWELSLQAVRRFILGDEKLRVRRKFVGNPSLVDRAMVTLATGRGLLLVGDNSVGGAGANAVTTALMMAGLFPVYANLLSQFVTRRDELFDPARHLHQPGRADIGAVGEPEQRH